MGYYLIFQCDYVKIKMNILKNLLLSMAISSMLFLLYLMTIAKELYPLYERFVLDGQKYVGETYTIYYIEYLESVFLGDVVYGHLFHIFY